jgi:hypothetical protein
MVFNVLCSSLAVQLGGAVVGVSYGIPKLHSRIDIAFNGIHGVHQTSMNMQNYL